MNLRVRKLPFSLPNGKLWRFCFQPHAVTYSSQKEQKIKAKVKKLDPRCIRNFGIIAHIDHGKSTLSDRLMEFTGNISKTHKNEQVLDNLQVERERGITVKAQTVSLFPQIDDKAYLLNLIDTPGHVDFSHELHRSLVACQGVLLLVDANQGVQAQTVANYNLALSYGLVIIPVLNKIDLKSARPEIVVNQLNLLFGIEKDDILKVSAKLGIGIENVIDTIIKKIPPPNGDTTKPFRALLYDSWYSQYQGVVCLIVIIDGSLSVGDEVTSYESSVSYVVKELGILYPEEVSLMNLSSGQVGYFKANMKYAKDAKIGSTWFKKGDCVEALPQIMESKPMVYAGIFPIDQSQLQDLKKALEKLMLNDSSVKVKTDSSSAFGSGWRLGFLGLLHLEVFCQRLHQEFGTDVLVTTPGIPYKIKIKGKNNIKFYGDEEIIISDASKMPDPKIIVEYFEPMVQGTIITPLQYYSSILKLCMDRRGVQKNVSSIDDNLMMLTYKFPMAEIATDFFNAIKVLSSGFASFDYEELGYESTQLKKVDILINGKIVNELCFITHATQTERMGRNMCLRLKENIEPELYLIAIQASVEGKVIARENIKPQKKNVTAKLYGGDVTRRMKLLERQKEGKTRMRIIGGVRIEKDVFLKILKR